MLKIGDRVKEVFLGEGEVTDYVKPKYLGLVFVKFDKTPPVRYNMGVNPAAVFTKDLKKVSSND